MQSVLVNRTMENFGRSLDRGYEVIVDEADSYYDSGNTLRHKSLQWITTGKGFGKDINPPKAVTLISATLVSCLIKRVENERNLVDKLGKDDIFFTQNSKDYISAVSFKPFEYKGKSIFLKHEECNWEKVRQDRKSVLSCISFFGDFMSSKSKVQEYISNSSVVLLFAEKDVPQRRFEEQELSCL